MLNILIRVIVGVFDPLVAWAYVDRQATTKGARAVGHSTLPKPKPFTEWLGEEIVNLFK